MTCVRINFTRNYMLHTCIYIFEAAKVTFRITDHRFVKHWVLFVVNILNNFGYGARSTKGNKNE